MSLTAVLPSESNWYLCIALKYGIRLLCDCYLGFSEMTFQGSLTRDLQDDNCLLLFQRNILVMRIVLLLYRPDITSVDSPCYDQTNAA